MLSRVYPGNICRQLRVRQALFLFPSVILWESLKRLKLILMHASRRFHQKTIEICARMSTQKLELKKCCLLESLSRLRNRDSRLSVSQVGPLTITVACTHRCRLKILNKLLLIKEFIRYWKVPINKLLHHQARGNYKQKRVRWWCGLIMSLMTCRSKKLTQRWEAFKNSKLSNRWQNKTRWFANKATKSIRGNHQSATLTRYS